MCGGVTAKQLEQTQHRPSGAKVRPGAPSFTFTNSGRNVLCDYAAGGHVPANDVLFEFQEGKSRGIPPFGFAQGRLFRKGTRNRGYAVRKRDYDSRGLKPRPMGTLDVALKGHSSTSIRLRGAEALLFHGGVGIEHNGAVWISLRGGLLRFR